MSVRVHYFQHVPFEGLAALEPLLLSRGHRVTGTRFYLGEAAPPPSEIDWLIILGGPLGACDDHLHGWMREEKRFIERAIREGKMILGICLGAQLVADVLGARVYHNHQKEIGWFPVQRTEHDASSLLGGFADPFMAFHWHGDTFDLPKGARQLARNECCEQQAFGYGQNVLALQFHIESTQESVRQLIVHCGNELISAPYIQSADDITDRPSYVGGIQESLALLVQVIEQRAEAIVQASVHTTNAIS